MNIDDLRYFVAAASVLNLSHASKQLGISQSALSHSVARLEEELGQKLFRKEGRHIVLTSHGKSLAERSELIVSEVLRLKKDFTSDTAPALGTYRIGATHGEVLRLTARAFAKLSTGEGTLFEISSLRSGEIISQLADKLLDIGICINPHAHPELQIEEIATLEMVPTVRVEHPILKLSKGTQVNALSRYPLAIAKPLPGVAPCSTHPVFHAIDEEMVPTYLFDTFDTAREIVLSSQAWALLPKGYSEDSHSLVSLGGGRYEKKISLALVTGKNDLIAGSLRTLLPLLKLECRG